MTHCRMQREKWKSDQHQNVAILSLQIKRWQQARQLLLKNRLPHVYYPNILDRIVYIACDGNLLKLKLFRRANDISDNNNKI